MNSNNQLIFANTKAQHLIEHVSQMLLANNLVNVIDIVADYCIKNSMEIEQAATIIKHNPTIKAKVKTQSMQLKLIKIS
jgi:hypothetical protein